MIRDLRKADIPALTEIYNWYIRNTEVTFETECLSEDQFGQRASAIRGRYPYIVLEENRKTVGYAYLNTFNPRAAYNWTADVSIYLDHKERGRGYGTGLMNAVIGMAERDGYVNLVSIVTAHNAASCHLHEKCGFKKEAHFENFGYKNGKWLDVLYYVKKIRNVTNPPEQPQNLPYEE